MYPAVTKICRLALLNWCAPDYIEGNSGEIVLSNDRLWLVYLRDYCSSTESLRVPYG